MADDRKIIHGVRHNNVTITDADELAKVLTPEMHQRLKDAGSITGDWGMATEVEAEPAKKTGKTKKE